MVVFIAVVGGLLFSIFILFCVMLMLAKRKGLSLLEWFLISIAIFNGLGLAFVIWSTYDGRNPYVGANWILNYDSITVLTFLLSNLVLIGAVMFGWYLVAGFKKSLQDKYNFQSKSINLSEKSFIKKFTFIAWVMLFLSIISYWLYTKPYGGFINYLEYSRAVRAGVSSINNELSFLKVFGGLSFFSSYLFFGALVNKNLSKRGYYLGFFISLLFSVYVLYSWVGRVSLAVYLLTFILGYVLYNYKSVGGLVRKLITFSVIGFILIVISDMILGTEKDSGIVGMLSKELSFPFVSYIFQVDTIDFRWFKDIIVAPIYVLPERIWGGMFNIELASSFNTLSITGFRKGEGTSGSIPIDMLSLGHIQASILGIVVIGFLWGAFIYIVENLLKKISNHSLYSIIYANVVLNVVVLSVFYSDPQHIISRNFPLIFGFLTLWLYLKFTRKRQDGERI